MASFELFEMQADISHGRSPAGAHGEHSGCHSPCCSARQFISLHSEFMLSRARKTCQFAATKMRKTAIGRAPRNRHHRCRLSAGGRGEGGGGRGGGPRLGAQTTVATPPPPPPTPPPPTPPPPP